MTTTFVSYSWESSEHSEWVRALVDRLRTDGLEVFLDQQDTLPGDSITGYMEAAATSCDTALVVCTPHYKARADNRKGGVGYENSILSSRLVNAEEEYRVIPILRSGEWLESSPVWLRDLLFADFRTASEYERSYSALLQALRDDEQRHTDSLPAESQSKSFSSSITSAMESLKQKVRTLTQEQYGTLETLHGPTHKRARISGCAGSGKTLVAAEKAIRLADAGLSVLMVCHNPILSTHIRDLTLGHRVDVIDFCSLIAQLDPSQGERDEWSIHSEPDTQALERAAQAASASLNYQAIIVDEGQDFRNEWWRITESSLAHKETGLFYVFCDDSQSLHSHRATYNINSTCLDISKNCRNGGEVFSLVRRYTPNSPPPEPRLAGEGRLLVKSIREGRGLDSVCAALQELGTSAEDTVLLLGGSKGTYAKEYKGKEIYLEQGVWQEAVKSQFERTYGLDTRGTTFPDKGKDIITRVALRFSNTPAPQDRDLELVKSLAKRFHVRESIKKKIKGHKRFKDALRWRTTPNGLKLDRSDKAEMWSAEIILHFLRPDWHESLPAPKAVELAPNTTHAEPNRLRVFAVSQFKGLESDSVILLMQGKLDRSAQEIYVGASRARGNLAVLVDSVAQSLLPEEFACKLKF